MMALSPSPHCSLCKQSSSQTKLFRCQGCNIVFYCRRPHQVADRDDHKQACNGIKKKEQAVTVAERKLRDGPSDMFIPPNRFEQHAGLFWGVLETRAYM